MGTHHLVNKRSAPLRPPPPDREDMSLDSPHRGLELLTLGEDLAIECTSPVARDRQRAIARPCD